MKQYLHKSNALFVVVSSLSIVLVVSFGLAVWQNSKGESAVPIGSYEECILQKDAKILETYPEECIYGGLTYTNDAVVVDDQPATDSNSETSSTSLPDDSKQVGELVINEWSVKFPLYESTKDANYTKVEAGENDEEIIRLSVSRVSEFNAECSIQSIVRVPNNTNLSGEQFKVMSMDGAREIVANLDGYLYFVVGAHDFCGPNSMTDDEINLIIKDMRTGILDLQKQ